MDSGHADHTGPSLNRITASATTHCMTGCAIGEVSGLVIATALGWGTVASIALAVALAFVFGFTLTMRPLLGAGLGFDSAAGLALAADTASITVMEIVDNAIMLVIPGAMEAGLDTLLFWRARLRAGGRLGRGLSRQPLPDQARPRARRGPRAPPRGARVRRARWRARRYKLRGVAQSTSRESCTSQDAPRTLAPRLLALEFAWGSEERDR